MVIRAAGPHDIPTLQSWSGESTETLARAIDTSEATFACELDGALIAVWGVYVVSLATSMSVLWLYPSPEIRRYAKRFVNGSRDFCQRLAAERRILVYTPSEFVSSQKWLEIIGFRFMSQIEYQGRTLLLYRMG